MLTGMTSRWTLCIHPITSVISPPLKEQTGLPLGNQEVQTPPSHCNAALGMFDIDGLTEKTVWKVPRGFFFKSLFLSEG